jgi:hypothetical protein
VNEHRPLVADDNGAPLSGSRVRNAVLVAISLPDLILWKTFNNRKNVRVHVQRDLFFRRGAD